MLNQMVLLGMVICTYFIGYTEGTYRLRVSRHLILISIAHLQCTKNMLREWFASENCKQEKIIL